MWSGMRAYGVAITLIWTLSSVTVLFVLSAASRGGARLAFGGGALLEIGCAAATYWFLQRVNRAGRFDVRVR
jgi:hypothetical protein